MDYTNESVFENTSFDKGSEEWKTFYPVGHDKVAAFDAASPRSTHEPRYVNIVHINRYRTA
jgi:hypothetical protein